MKKSILAIFLAVIAMAQVHAQDSDLRSAPDLPTFKVTLNYSSANTDQGTIISTVATGSKVAYNSKSRFHDHGEARICPVGYNDEYGYYWHVTERYFSK